jgi:DNA repair exonuclease SbcCD ATPase subunit
MTRKCSNGHNQQWQCHAGAPPVCTKCENDRKQAEKKVQRDLDAKIKREAKVQKHLKELAKLDEQMAQIAQSMEDLRLDNEQRAVLEQKRKDLETAKERANMKQYSPPGDPQSLYRDDRPTPRNKAATKTSNQPATPASPKSTPNQHSSLREHIKIDVEHNKSQSKTEWQRQKDQENASNPAIDNIMEMVGLENVKIQVLRIKARVDTSIRQGIDLKKERLGLVLLGNPGTGTILVHSGEEVANTS